jgi:hypothetical protein
MKMYFKFFIVCFTFGQLILGCKSKGQEIENTNVEVISDETQQIDSPQLVTILKDTVIDQNKETTQSVSEAVNYQDENREKSLVGHFIYMADAAVFTPCGAKKAIPVEMYTEVYKSLEEAYLNTVDGGTPCFVEVLGSVKKRPSYDGGKAVDMLVIDKVIEVQFYRECP